MALLFPDLHHLRTKDFIYQVPKVELSSKKPMKLTFTEGSAHDVDLLVRNESSWPYNWSELDAKPPEVNVGYI